ncbi:hypothetical protein AYO45_05995 [Gammaproteobacteria bacterium SCGC AG-212-F23]|nr:hypothetical protein AYO45_05995 [Gammaproteobacteria bacterium SCGC AG-212-F23]
MKKFIFLILLSCFLSACASPYMVEEYEQGKYYFKKGNYKKAYEQLFPAAVCGNPEAQYAVGYLVYYGYGVDRDEVIGIFWIQKSAEHHYPRAIEALKKMRCHCHS